MDSGSTGRFPVTTRIGPQGPPRIAPPPSFLRRHARTILGVALGALLIHDVFGAHGLLALRRTQLEITRLRAEISQLDKENRGLSDQVKALKTDPSVIERIAREEMGLAKRSEKIFKLPPPVPAPKAK
jgi:cell division protein FtsB